jgi:hypothetical protein
MIPLLECHDLFAFSPFPHFPHYQMVLLHIARPFVNPRLAKKI